jgi:hypothetical protein
MKLLAGFLIVEVSVCLLDTILNSGRNTCVTEIARQLSMLCAMSMHCGNKKLEDALRCLTSRVALEL